MSKKTDKKRLNVLEVVRIDAVIPSSIGKPFDYHTHGLDAFDHPEFQVYAPKYCASIVASVLWSHVDAVVNDGERFTPETVTDSQGTIFGYLEVPGHSDGDPSRLLIVDRPDMCVCQYCQGKGGNCNE
ncbi:MAG: hypothetical protein QUV05_00450 [Phycisphaerae bacterium]|nr:hypothetical protein [Phycisphaerae bacterium]